MTFWAYIIRCSDGLYYTGHTDDLDRRMAEHQSGAVPGFTSVRRPVDLMWSEGFQTRDEALATEAKVKNWSRAKKEGLFRADWDAVSIAARKPAPRYAASTSSAATRDERGKKATSLDFARAKWTKSA